MSNVIIGTRAWCDKHEIGVEKKGFSDRYTLLVDDRPGKVKTKDELIGKLKMLKCDDKQIKSMMDDLEQYYMNE